jgi:hypothetical protein
MRRLVRWLVILLIAGAPAVASAQGADGVREQAPGGGHDRVATDQGAGSAMPRFSGDERHSRPQRVIFVMLTTLVAVTLIFGLATVVHEFRGQRIRRRRP